MLGTYQFSIISYALLINSQLSLYVAIFSWCRRSVPGAKYLVIMIADIVIVPVVYILEAVAIDIPVKIFWTILTYLGLLNSTNLFLLFALDYTGREKFIKTSNTLLLNVLPTIALALVFTNDWHHLVWTDVSYDADEFT